MTCVSIADWVEFAVPVRTALFTALGVEGTTKVRLIARMTQDEWTTATSTITIGDAGLTPMQSSQIGLFWDTARLVCYVTKTAEEQKLDAEKAAEAELAKITAAAAATAAAASSTPTSTSTGGRKFALESVTDQTDKTELTVMDAAAIAVCYRRYNEKFGATDADPVVPAINEEPTYEQLTGLSHVVKNGAPPFVDFALFCPHGNRARRNHAFSGLVLGPDGNLVKVEAKGPDTIEAWQASWKIFKVAAVMLDVASVGALDLYHDPIKQFSTIFGPDLWMLLSQRLCL